MRRSNVSQEVAALKSDLTFDFERANANDELWTVESNLCFNMLRINSNEEQQTIDLDSCLNITRSNTNQELLTVDSNSLLSISRSNANQVEECVVSVTPEKHHEQEKKSSFQITSVTAQKARLNLHNTYDFCELNLEMQNGTKRMDVDSGQSSEDTSSSSYSDSSSSCSTSTINSNMVQFPLSSNPSAPRSSKPLEFIPSGNIIDSKIPFSIPSNTATFSENAMKLQMDEQVLSLVTTCVTSSSNSSNIFMAPISHEKQDRFKIVKLVSNDPVKRGRWACTDFTDENIAHQGISKCEMSREDNCVRESTNIGLPNVLYSEHGVNTSDITSHYLINQTYPVISGEELTLSTQQHSLPLYRIIFPVSEASQSNLANSSQAIQTIEDVYSQAITFSNQAQAAIIPQSSSSLSQEPILAQTRKNISEILSKTLTEEKSVSHQSSINEVTDLSSTLQLCVPSTSDFQNINSQVLHSGFAAVSQTEVQSCASNHLTSRRGFDFTSKAPLLEGTLLTLEANTVSEDDNAESATSDLSSLAIDNKIEQAMDLVKSHLMLAVREEVEVLKEKITELMDKIFQLEYENGILKANASQETLRKITAVGLQPFSQTQLQQHLTTTELANNLQHPR
ncbi:uncharacterized protein LOC143243988 [Tachypleus tridentatus]|uniref:uncharacterized protein LOC143243988 n=1 Tax=Tachypleus tridentatus TaxID=6853 RepID=UPI003FD0A5EE